MIRQHAGICALVGILSLRGLVMLLPFDRETETHNVIQPAVVASEMLDVRGHVQETTGSCVQA